MAIEVKNQPNLWSLNLDTEIYPDVNALTGLSESIYVQAQREAEGPIRNFKWGFSVTGHDNCRIDA